MPCPNCQHDNPPSANFCMGCGTKLESTCSQCGVKLPPEAKFCPQCGTKAAESAPSPVPKLEQMHAQLQRLIPDALVQKYLSAEPSALGENRLITALFADISGSTALSATHSTETMFHLIQDCFKALVNLVASYEGCISGFRGDGLLALFGAPTLHENDAERAILAALDMREAMRQRGLEISVGINTALMTVGEIQTQLHREYTAYGLDINLAARLQQGAGQGQILVGETTYRRTHRTFEFEATPPLLLKGIDEPVTAYRVVKALLHSEKVRGIEGLRAQMIGREREFADLKAAADQWLKGQGQMVSVIGEAGIGKSRLVSEMKAYLYSTDLRNERIQSENSVNPCCLEGRCISIGQPISYWPFLDILRSYLGLGEDDSEAEMVEKVRQKVEALFPDRADDVLPFLGHLMHLRFGGELDKRLTGYSAEQIRHQTLMRLRDLFLAIAEQQPLLLILEDLHWADDVSLDVIALLIDELTRARLMLLCVYRPERTHRVWQLSNIAQRKSPARYTEVRLQQLSPHQSRRLIEELLAIDNLPENVRQTILVKSEGNPFFIEEVIRSLIERGLVYREDDRWKAKEEAVSVEVPDTIQSVILARVDRLGAEARQVLQCAAVIGRLFKYRLLSHLTQQQRELDRHLSELEERELVYSERTVPELEYAFKHALTQEATYHGILERRRQAFHRQVAEGIERLYRERIEDFYEELAYHWERSGERAQTLVYLMKAGEKAARHYANEAAIDYYTRAIGLAKALGWTGDRLAEIYDARGELYYWISSWEESISDTLLAARLYTQQTQRAIMYSRLSLIYGSVIVSVADPTLSHQNEARRYARQAMAEIDPRDKSRATVLAVSWRVALALGLEEGLPLLRGAIAISEEMEYKDLMAIQYMALHYLYWNKGLSQCSNAFDLQSREARAKALSHLPEGKSDLSSYALTCMLLACMGSGGGRAYLAREALEAGLKSGNNLTVVYAAMWVASYHIRRGDVKEAITAYEQGWRAGIRARILNSPMDRIVRNLMPLYVSAEEHQKLVGMMQELIDSTLVLHRKSEVHPGVKRKWNGIVENIYKLLRAIAPATYREFERSLASRLKAAETDGERFFYYGQRLWLALLDGRQEDAAAYAQKLAQLRPGAGVFPQRLSEKVEVAMELLQTPPDGRQTAALNGLKASEKLWNFQETVEAIGWVLPEEQVNGLVDWDGLSRLALEEFQERQQNRPYFIPWTWVRITQLYGRYGGQNHLQPLALSVQQTMAEGVRRIGLTHLLPEPVAFETPDTPALAEPFTDDPTAVGWEWVNPTGYCRYELLTGGGLEISVPPDFNLARYNVFTPNYDAPRLLRRVPPHPPNIGGREGGRQRDFLIETKVSDGSGGKRFGGLLVWKDEANYLRLETFSGVPGLPRVQTEEAEAVSYNAMVSGKLVCPGMHLFEAEAVRLRLERRGERFTGYASKDGENWLCCGYVDLPLEDPIQVGIHALCPESPTSVTRFGNFKLYLTT